MFEQSGRGVYVHQKSRPEFMRQRFSRAAHPRVAGRGNCDKMNPMNRLLTSGNGIEPHPVHPVPNQLSTTPGDPASDMYRSRRGRALSVDLFMILSLMIL